jgi:hypothetical protein
LRGLYCSAFDDSFAHSELRAFLTANTQGSAKPTPWAKFWYAFGVLDIPLFLSLPFRYLMYSPGNAENADIAGNGKTPNAKRILSPPTSARYLVYFSPLILVAATPRCVLLRPLLFRTGIRPFSLYSSLGRL